MPTVAVKQAAVVTKGEIEEIAEWERKFAKAKNDQATAEREVKLRRIQLAEKVLGVKSEDDLKALTPEQVNRRMVKRLDAGDWRANDNTPAFTFAKTHEGRYPSWAQLYIKDMGATAAARIKAETPVSYSYCVEVSPT